MVQAQAAVVRQLGVVEVAFVLGGSMGGMQALEWALDVTQPTVRGIGSLSASGRHHPWQIGISECQRQAIYADPNWNGGNYTKETYPSQGLSVARMIAMVTYRTHPAYNTKFGRSIHTKSHTSKVFGVENYLHAQGEKFVQRGFDPGAYVSLTYAMDSHDIERGRGSYAEVLRSIKIPVLITSISSDVLYPVSEQLELSELIPNAQHHIVQSDEGHDGFLLEHGKIGLVIRGFLAGLEEGRFQPSSKL
jgi:homoserine O-acetyltransferase